MDRTHRFKLSGIIFFIVLFGILFSTVEGFDFFGHLFNPTNGPDGWSSALVTLAAAFATYASLEGFGYIFNSVFYFTWCEVLSCEGEHGYSAEMRSHFRNGQMREIVHDRKVECESTDGADAPGSGIPHYSLDVYYSYFHQPRVHKNMEEWIQRRWTVFFAGGTEIVAIGTAFGISAAMILSRPLTLTLGTYSVIGAAILFAIVCGINAWRSKKEALSMMDLWMYANFNPEGKCTVRRIERDLDRN